ncbi:hypothetical protein TI05_11335 [Achromatium sp. WMS3]|nr:hypothetical protein TI05_11335 [Achromatium sp. WMS3]
MMLDMILEAMQADPLLTIFINIMLILVIIDTATFFSSRIQHFDCKGLLTSLGLLGTFLGIALGLKAFNPQDIQASMPAFLHKLKFAFLTSILGMLFATILHFIQMTVKIFGGQKTTKLQTPEEQIANQTAKIQQQVDTQTMRLDDLQRLLQNIYWVLYENRRRFLKIGTQGEELSANAQEWEAIYDNDSDLTWEHKTQSGEQDAKRLWSWSKVKIYQQTANQKQLAGFNDWRLPTPEELHTIFLTPKGMDKRFFGVLDDPARSYPFFFSAHADPDDPNEKGLAVSKNQGQTNTTTEAHVLLVRGGN